MPVRGSGSLLLASICEMADGHVSVPPPAPAAEEAPTEPQPGSGEAPHPAPQSGQPQTAIVAEPAAEEPAPSTAAAAAPPAGQQPAAAEAAPEVQPKQEPMHEAKEEPQGEAGEAAAPKEEPKEEPQAGAEPKAEPQAEAGAAPPSDAALVARLKELLGQVDLATTTGGCWAGLGWSLACKGAPAEERSTTAGVGGWN